MPSACSAICSFRRFCRNTVDGIARRLVLALAHSPLLPCYTSLAAFPMRGHDRCDPRSSRPATTRIARVCKEPVEACMLRVTILGSGYVGLVTGACLADLGCKVVCADVDARKIRLLERGD